MPLMTPEQYVESLRDGRVTYWNGERIEDITVHPMFVGPVEMASEDYRYDDPEHGAQRRFTTETGTEAHRIFEIPRNEADLMARVEMMKHASVGTLPTSVYSALVSARDDVAKVNPQYAENIDRMYRYCRDNDLRAALTITDPKGDRSRRADQQDDPDLYLRIVERREDGIVVRGAKLHISAASLVHELVVIPTKGMKAEEADYAVSFSIPVNAPGITVINRSAGAPGINPFDFPASAHHAIPEGFVVFDDVFVPWDRVFLAGEVQLASVMARSLGLWERSASLVEAVRLSEVLVGLAELVTEMQGKSKDSSAQNNIVEVIAFHQHIKMTLEYACQNYETTPSGMVCPNVLAVNLGKYYIGANFHNVVKCLHDLGGGLVITLPHEADLRNPETGGYIRKYLHTRNDVDVETRMRVYTLIRDLTADAYGGWQLVVALQSGGGLSALRMMIRRSFDMTAAKRAALTTAGALPD